MSDHSVRVEQRGRTGSVFLDGVDISKAVAEVRADLSARRLPVVELTMMLPSASFEVDQASVRVDKTTADALAMLGWTPPA